MGADGMRRGVPRKRRQMLPERAAQPGPERPRRRRGVGGRGRAARAGPILLESAR